MAEAGISDLGKCQDRSTISAQQYDFEDNRDITGATITGNLKRGWPGNPHTLATFSVGNGFTITDAVNGVFERDAFFANYGPGTYYMHIIVNGQPYILEKFKLVATT